MNNIVTTPQHGVLPSYQTAREMLSGLRHGSKDTWEHSLRVNYYCRTIGRLLNLSRKQMKLLSLLSIFHDIGKLGVSRDVLGKTGKLNAKEWGEIKLHSQYGYQLASEIPEIQSTADYILCHHEHWDGSGYPNGLCGKKIPYLCRILAVSDAFDAMTADRSYRKAMKREEAVCELERCAGKQFDAEIVSLFVRSGTDAVSVDNLI